jgi:hypothetical protein
MLTAALMGCSKRNALFNKWNGPAHEWFVTMDTPPINVELTAAINVK